MTKAIKQKKQTRQRNARGQGDQLRADLIEAAIRLLARIEPNEQVSLRSVAKEAKVAAPSVYLHFRDLNVLFLAVLEKLFAEQIAIRNKADEEAAKAGGGAWEKLLAGAHALVKFGLERPGHYKVLYEGRIMLHLSNPKIATLWLPLRARTIELVTEIVKTKSATRATKDAARLALLFWAGLHGIISLQINKPMLDWPEATVLATQLAKSLIRPK